MQAVVYLRVSTDEQVERTSLDTQDDECRKWCEREGYGTDRVFRDEGASAKSSKRPALIEMLSYCKKHRKRIDCVVVYKLDRFARNQVDHHSIRAMLATYGIRLASATETLTDDPAGRLLEGMLAAFAQFDNEVRGERARNGMKSTAERGGWVHKAPLGYLKARTPSGDPTLKLDPKCADIIRAGFERYAAGGSQSEALRWMNAQGLRSGYGGVLTVQRWGQMLRSPVYAGLVASKLVEEPVQGNWPPLVDPGTWAKIQRRMARRATPWQRRTDRPEFVLRRFVRCGKCDGALTGGWSRSRSGKRYGYYRCRECGDNIPRAKLADAFVALLETVRLDPDYLGLWRALVRRVAGGRWHEAEAVKQATEAQLRRTEQAKARLVDLYIMGNIDQARYEKRMRKIETEVKASERAVETEREIRLDIETVITAATVLYGNPAKTWKTASLAGKAVFQHFLFPEGVQYEDGSCRTTVTSSVCVSSDAESRKVKDGTPSRT
ncbi:MAG: recombinase family protein [Planctomycetota bacterium]